MLRWLIWPFEALLQMRGRLFPWVPLCVGAGVGLWFALEEEPGPALYAVAGVVLLAGLWLWRRGPDLAQPAAVIGLCLALGFLAAGGRAHWVASPMLERPFYGPVLGRIIEIDRSASDALRVTLDRVVLGDLAPDATPRIVRISLHGKAALAGMGPEGLVPGQVVMNTARLAAPEGPTEPGGFDFRRMAFFDGMGAVGYSRSPLVLWREPAAGAQLINRLRMHLSRAVMAAVPGDAGAFASGAMTGDRSGISQDTVAALRDSNLAHLLAISGMNMAFLTGFVFVLLRYGVALVPVLALRVNSKKLAAGAAFAVALFYLLLSGANVATERAFLMVTVMLGAVLFDRRALSLRSVAVSALVLLLWQPESLTEPGFQLSFAATVALIWAFGALDRRVMQERISRWVMPVFTLVLSSVVAGVATAPFAAAHFNRFTDYGLVANLLTVPMMSLLMGAGAVAALLAPFGLAGPALWVMGLAARWILFVAHWIAGLHGAVTPIVAPGPWVLPLFVVAGAWAILMQGRARALAVLPLVLALGLWAGAERPVLLISSDGGLAGLMGPAGRALSADKGAGFTARNWLENDGDLAGQAEAWARPGFHGPKAMRGFILEHDPGRDGCPQGPGCGLKVRGVILAGKDPDVAAACGAADLVITSAVLTSAARRQQPAGCQIIDRGLLRQIGAVAVWRREGGWAIRPAAQNGRIWMGQKSVPNLPSLTTGGQLNP